MMRILIYTFFFFISFQLCSQQADVVDFIQVDAAIQPDFSNKTISGTATYTFKILKNTDSVFLDAHQMNITPITDEIEMKATKDKVWFLNSFKKDETYTVSFSFWAKPKQTFYFMHSGDEFWTQGQGKYTSHWLPSLDDTNDKIIFNITVTAPKHLTVVANGVFQEKTEESDNFIWKFSMKHPMSSYLVAIAAAEYEVLRQNTASGIPLELYYKKNHSDKAKATYRNTIKTFDFLENEIGLRYPWEVYKQVPVRDFFYAGMENTTITLFSEFYMADKIGIHDVDYTNVEAHELAHQWFGNLVTAKSDEHHWLQEGFATYYALLAEKNIYGADYFYYRLMEYASLLIEQDVKEKDESLLNPKASSLTFYQKGAWALHVLKSKIGEEKFKKAVHNFLNKYQFDVATTDDFMNEIKAVTTLDLTDFEQKWFYEKTFPQEDVYSLLMKSDYIQEYGKLIGFLQNNNADNFSDDILETIKSKRFQMAETAIASVANKPETVAIPVYEQALTSSEVSVRRSVALTIKEIPEVLHQSFNTLLSDSSYVTRQVVMEKLWEQFPYHRHDILEQMKNEVGLQNKNIRQSWLMLVMRTPDYETARKANFIEEARNYASPNYSFEVREIAFENIHEMNLWDARTFSYLLDAVKHPSWRFAKKSRELFHELWNSLSEFEKAQMIDKLNDRERELLSELTIKN